MSEPIHKIAEACGWINQGNAKQVPALGLKWFNPAVGIDPLPDYYHSINSIRAAVLAQDAEFQRLFSIQIMYRVRSMRLGFQNVMFFHQLTAADWCAAFLAVLESKKKPL